MLTVYFDTVTQRIRIEKYMPDKCCGKYRYPLTQSEQVLTFGHIGFQSLFLSPINRIFQAQVKFLTCHIYFPSSTEVSTSQEMVCLLLVCVFRHMCVYVYVYVYIYMYMFVYIHSQYRMFMFSKWT